MTRSEIVVGVDGSGYSLRAIEWAVAEAGRRNAALRIVHAIPSWLFETVVNPRVRQVREWMRNTGQEVLNEAAAKAGDHTPGVEVSAQLVPGGPSRALIEAAEDALLLVVGSHGSGTLTGLLLGSVTLQVAGHAPCPTVVVRHAEPDPGREIVVGVDGSKGSQAALEFGFTEAALRKVALRAVHAWTDPAWTGPGDMQSPMFDRDFVRAEQDRVLAESLAGWQERFPDVKVVRDPVQGRPSRVLTAASSGADLLVVGTRGLGGFTGLMLGSVSHAMLHHARCALAVVPTARN